MNIDALRYHELSELDKRVKSDKQALLCEQCLGEVILFRKDLIFTKRLATGRVQASDSELTTEDIVMFSVRKLYKDYDLLPEVEGLRSPSSRRADGVSVWVKEWFLEKLSAINAGFRTQPQTTLVYIFKHDLYQLDAVIECCDELVSKLEAASRL